MPNPISRRSGATRNSLVLFVLVLGGLLFMVYLGSQAGDRTSVSGDELEPAAWVVAQDLDRAKKEAALAEPSAADSAALGRDAALNGVRLAGAGKLQGVVLERQSGAAIPAAEVSLLPLPPIGSKFIGRLLHLAGLAEGIGKRSRAVARTSADALGQFVFEGVREGRYYIDIQSDYHLLEAPQRVSVLASGEGGPVDVWVRGAGRVLGQVLDSKGDPLASATVMLTAGPNLFLKSAREGGLRVFETRADREGRFGFGGVAPGSGYDLTGTAPHMAISHLSNIVVELGRDTRVVLRARVGGGVVGRVFSARFGEHGQQRGRVPLAGAHVGAIPRGFRDLRFLREILEQTHSVTDEDGAYHMTAVPPGDVDIVAYAPEHILGAGALVVVREGEVSSAAAISLETGEVLRGRVLDAEGLPIEGVHATWATFDFEAMGQRGMDLTLAPFLSQAVEGFAFPHSDSEGRFLGGPFPGAAPHRLRLYKQGFAEREVECTLGEGEQVFTLQRGGSIEGVVMDREEARPVTRFSIQTIHRVETREDAPGRFNAFSGEQVYEDERGHFFLESMRPGKVEFTVTAPGYSSTTISGTEVLAGEIARGVIVMLMPGGVLRGHVVDSEGEAIAGASVMAFDESRSRGRRFGMRQDPTRLPKSMPRFSRVLPPALMGYAAGLGLLGDEVARTAPDGSFELSDLAPGSLTVVAMHPEYAAGHSQELILEQGTSIDGVRVELEAGAAVFGTVKDRHGRPVVGSMVVALSPARFGGSDARSVGGGLYQAQTDSEGAYELLHMSAGSFFIVSTRGDAALNPLSFFSTLDFDLVNIPAGERVRFDVIDESLGGTRVFGRVIDAGEPVRRGNINAICWEGENFLGVDWKVARVDASGAYEFEGLAPGEYQFQLEGNRRSVEITALVPDAPEFHLDLELPHGVIAGRVLADASGEVVAGAEVYLRRTREAPPDGWLASLVRQRGQTYGETSDARGAFRFEGLGAGRYELLVDSLEPSEGLSLAAPEPQAVELGRDELRLDHEIRLRHAAELSGIVFGDNGELLAGAKIVARRADDSGLKAGQARTGAEGEFRLRGLSAGQYDLVAAHEGYASRRLAAVTVSGEGQALIRIILERGVEVTLVLTGADGLPLSGASARLERTDAPGADAGDPGRAVRALFAGQASTDAEGHLGLGRFEAGTYQLTVWRGLERKEVPGIQLAPSSKSKRVRVSLP
ncbi:MAG: carboxypeptidase-like regulatory domain-containing protein [bacterium]|nr:carboxypeptidase regulatory-like domain-containing protein [Planctomycetota bacterium]HIL53024.1 carboxypeptidase regulatory-like domain-containing protein [Planctomycetota bacterium]